VRTSRDGACIEAGISRECRWKIERQSVPGSTSEYLTAVEYDADGYAIRVTIVDSKLPSLGAPIQTAATWEIEAAAENEFRAVLSDEIGFAGDDTVFLIRTDESGCESEIVGVVSANSGGRP
jgi:hypothetical protein